jgi:hypothetical protein
MNSCKTCLDYKETFKGKGICKLYDEYVNEDYCCDDWNDNDEKAYWISESKGC